jgi:anti-sigma-K factor RskA
MIDETLQETASLYVLDLLTSVEARDFEELLSKNAELSSFACGLSEAAATLALDAPPLTPPASLKGRIMAHIQMEDEDQRNHSLSDEGTAFGSEKANPTEKTVIDFPTTPARSVKPLNHWLPWGLAAALALYGGILQTQQTGLKERIVSLEKENAISQMTISMLVSQYPEAKNATGVVIWNPEKQEGKLTFEQLPPQDPDKDYQIWVVDPKYKNPVNGGVFGVGKSGTISTVSFKPDAPVSNAKLFAISLEKKGGVPKAEGPMVLVSKNPLE